MTNRRLRVFLIGSGRRMWGNFVPALRAMSDDFEINGVYSRTFANARTLADRHDLTAYPELLDSPILECDVVIVSVNPEATPGVYSSLSDIAPGRALVADTPVLPNFRALRAMDALERFRVVAVAEDHMNFAQFSLVRDLLSAGELGRLTNVNLFNSGYYYHGLALIRSFFGFTRAHYYRRTNLGRSARAHVFHFPGRRKGFISEPYSRSDGRFMLVGERAIITDFDVWSTDRPVYRIEPRHDAAGWCGWRLETENRVHACNPEWVPALRALNVEGQTDFNLQKTCALIVILRSLLEDNMNRRYGLREGIYDRLVTLYGPRLPTFVDPLALVGGTALTPTFRLASRLVS